MKNVLIFPTVLLLFSCKESQKLSAMNELKKSDTVTWVKFTKAFATVKLPYTINEKSDQLLTDKRKLQNKNKHYLPNKDKHYLSNTTNNTTSRPTTTIKDIIQTTPSAYFSRNYRGSSSFDHYAIAQIGSGTKHPAMIYADKPMPPLPSCSRYYITSFDANGNLTDEMYIAGKIPNTSVVKECTINADHSFEVKTFQNNYQKPPEKEGYYDNPIVSTTLTETKTYRISDDGKFVEVVVGGGRR